MVRNRLLGTVVSLIGATSNTTCGTINSVNSNGESVSDQTYTVFCPATTEKTNAVLLSDNVMEQPGDDLVMNIAEVMIYKVITGMFCTESDLIPNRIEVIFNSPLSPDCMLGTSYIPLSYVPTAGLGKVSIGDSLYLYCGNDGWKEQIVTCDQHIETPDCGATNNILR